MTSNDYNVTNSTTLKHSNACSIFIKTNSNETQKNFTNTQEYCLKYSQNTNNTKYALRIRICLHRTIYMNKTIHIDY